MMRVAFFFFLFFPKYLHINVTSSPNILGDKQSGSYEGWEAGCAPGGGEHWRLATPLTLQQSLRHKSPEQLEDEGLLRFPHEGTVGPRVISLAWVDLLERQVMVWLVFSGEFTGEFSKFLESLYAPIPNRQNCMVTSSVSSIFPCYKMMGLTRIACKSFHLWVSAIRWKC